MDTTNSRRHTLKVMLGGAVAGSLMALGLPEALVQSGGSAAAGPMNALGTVFQL